LERYKSRIIDEAGRIIIPSELRKLLCFDTGDKVSLTAVSTIVILQKVESGSESDCTLCTVDELGRIDLPAELRQQMGWKEKSALALYHTDELMILKASENK
jgi:bifunctional DNA-binding transcriptional regulator/antitoxin component of YhaV-PrlF toxin-antitoxin module